MTRRAPAALGAALPVMIAGGAGFIGCNLADRLAREGEHVLVYDSLARPGVERNLDWLRRRHPRLIGTVIADIRDGGALADAAKDARAVFNFAAQVAVTTSLQNPMQDFEVNLLGTVALLEAVRRRGTATPVIFASTNKVYGDLADVSLEKIGERYLPWDAEVRRNGFDETRPLDFHTPYGCSKGGADQYVLDYARSFGVPTAVMRMSCIYGPRQLGTEDQGWVAHFLLRALAGAPVTIYGDGCQVRDILHVGDAVNAYVAAWRSIGKISGRAFNLGGGPDNAVSLNQLIGQIGALLGRPVDVRFADWRPKDQRYFVCDPRRVRAALDLPRPLGWKQGVAALLDSFAAEHGAAPRTRALSA